MPKKAATPRASRNRSFWMLLMMLMLVLIIPMSLMFISCTTYFSSKVRGDYIDMNRRVSATISERVDAYLQARMNFAYALSTNKTVKILATQVEHTTEEMLTLYNTLSGYLGSMQALGSFFTQSAVYFPMRGTVVTAATRMEPGDFYANHMALIHMDSNAFWQTVRGMTRNCYWPTVLSGKSIGTQRRVMVYVQPLTMGYMECRAYFISLIDEAVLGKLMLDGFGEDVHFMLQDAQGTILAQSAALTDAAGYHVFEYASAKTELCYVFYVPEAQVLGQVHWFYALWAGVMVCCLLVGLLIARAVADRLYAPVRALLDVAYPQGISGGTRSLGEEYGLITHVMHETRRQNERFQRELRGHYEAMRGHTLLLLLTNGANMDAERLLEAAEICGLPRRDAQYQVVMLEATNPAMLADIPEMTLCSVRLSAQRRIYVAAFSPGQGEALAARLCEIRGAQIGVSRVKDDLRALPRALSESSAAFARHLPEQTPFVTYDELLSDTGTIYYPAEKEIELFVAVRAGTFEDVRQLLLEIYDYNRNERKLIPDMMHYLFSNMIATALKLCDSPHDEAFDGIGQNARMLALIHEHERRGAHVFEDILALYEQLCALCAQNNQRKNQRIMQQVEAYLEEHHADHTLCLDSVADHFEVSYYFLSRIFKTETDQNFSEMLNGIRIRHAAELLQKTDTSVQDVAVLVGYTNWSTFLRAFRKALGTTPTQYRKAMGATPTQYRDSTIREL